jgi:predicted lipoprotein with Yx(FWY)xxD motif
MDATARPGSTIGRLGRRTTAFLGVVALIAACTNQSGGQATTRPVTQAAPSPAGSMSPATSGPAAVTLEVANDAELGDFVAGEGGMTLYVFLADEGSDGSACNGECATNWPPLTGTVAAGDGVTGEIGTIARDDGSLQVTLGGRPLYYFIGDEAAGDVNGQGLQDLWYLAGADGSPVEGSGAPPGQETPCGGRNCY